jgi:hypothetical protein
MSARYLSRVSRSLAVLAGLLIAAVSLAQRAPLTRPSASTGARVLPQAHPTSPSFGPNDLTYVRVSGIDFTTYNGGSWAGLGGSLSRYPTADVTMDAGLSVPSGAIVDYLELDYYDANATFDLSLTLLDCGPQGASCNVVAGGSLSSTGSAGYGSISTSGLNYTVTNAGNSLDAELLFLATDGSLAITGVIVGYRLQVSPAPAVAFFNDVPTSDFGFQFVEAFAAAGITVGCTSNPPFPPPVYCPDRNVTRREMAIFFAKALGLHFPN